MLIATSPALCKDRCQEAEIIPRLAKAGFQALDFNFCDMVDLPVWQNPAAAAAAVEALAAVAAENRLPWVQAHGPMANPFSDLPREQFKRTLIQPCLAACGRLGVPWMVMHCGSIEGAFDRDHRRLMLQSNAEFFRGYLPLCEKYRVGLALENGCDKRGRGRSFAVVPEDLADLVDAINHPLAGICWDTGHAHLQGMDQRTALASLGPRLKCLHVADNDGGSDLHLLPFAAGRAGVDWAAVAAGLRQAGYRGHWAYEAHNSFRALPEPVLDEALAFSVHLARAVVG